LKNIKEKIPKALPLVIEYLKIIKPTVVKNPKKEMALKYKNLASLKDIPILISAFEYRCQYFITGNIRDFEVKLIEKKLNLKIIKPAEFLKILKKKINFEFISTYLNLSPFISINLYLSLFPLASFVLYFFNFYTTFSQFSHKVNIFNDDPRLRADIKRFLYLFTLSPSPFWRKILIIFNP